MAVVHQTSATASGNSATATVNKPTGTVTGDVLVVAIKTGVISAAPAGWTQFANVSPSGGNINLYGYYKVAGASEPASYSWTIASSQQWGIGISRYSGVDAAVLDTSVSSAANLSTTVAAPSVTTATANAMLIGGYGNDSGATVTPPVALTERWEVGTARAEHASALQSTAGASGTQTWTAAATAFNTVWLTALRESNPAQTVSSPAFVGTSTQVFQPAVIGNTAIVAGFVPSSAQVFTPTVSVTNGPQTVTPSFVASSAQVFAPSLTQTGTLARVKATHQAAVSVVVDHEPL